MPIDPVLDLGLAIGTEGLEQSAETAGGERNGGKVQGVVETRLGSSIGNGLAENALSRQRRARGWLIGTVFSKAGPALSFSYSSRCSSQQNVPFSSIRRIAKGMPQ